MSQFFLIIWIVISLVLLTQKTEQNQVITLYNPVSIKANKMHPPFLAYEELLREKHNSSTKVNSENIERIEIGTDTTLKTSKVISQRVVLAPMLIDKKTQPWQLKEDSQSSEHQSDVDDKSWVDGLPFWQKMRLQEAQKRYAVLEEKKEFEKKKTPESSQQALLNYEGPLVIQGNIEFHQGLAYTNEHQIIVQRSSEGAAQEAGVANIKEGTYSIRVEDREGDIIAKLVTKNGKIVGEGGFRLSSLQAGSSKVFGPKISIYPVANFSGASGSFYNNPNNKGSAPSMSVFNGEHPFTPTDAHQGKSEFDNVSETSATIARAEMPGHMKGNMLVYARDEFYLPLFPDGMAQALKDIVSEKRQYNLSGEEVPIIWGRVSVEGKAIAGVSVEIEASADLQPIYFNAYNLPDENLKSTSENGLYAFVGTPFGMQSLLAKKADKYFSHTNVLVEESTASIAHLEGTPNKEEALVRVYDAFTGEAKASKIEIQSLEEPLEIPVVGTTKIQMTPLPRMSFLHAGGLDEYVSATYVYNDRQSYLHIPLLRESWLQQLKVSKKIGDVPGSGTLVGFVSSGPFEVYLAGFEDLPREHVVFFDSLGKAVDDLVEGGGFVIFNLPEGVYEPVLVLEESNKVYSNVVPVDYHAVTVLDVRF